MPSPDDREYSSREVRDVAGLSSRQLNDWDARGMLPHGRDSAEGWRRFTPREVFVLAVCAEIRKQFGTPVERLKYVQGHMLQDEANHFRAAAEMMATLGVGVWLLTDFEKTFVMDTELEFADLWEHGYFGHRRETGFVLLPVHPLVNRLLACLKEPAHVELDGRGHELLRAARAANSAQSHEEAMLLELVRSTDFERVEAVSPEGTVETIRATARPDPATQVSELLAEPYQRLSLVMKNGKVVSIEQEVVRKPKRVAR